MTIFRVYDAPGADGEYPDEWHAAIKDLVRVQAGNRCERCGHPYRKGMGEWSPCDERCTHQDDGPVRVVSPDGERLAEYRAYNGGLDIARAGWLADDAPPCRLEAQWRVLTVHHLNGDKLDCRWWNLCSLDQRCHLAIQGKVLMDRVWPWQHTPWFEIHAAGFYASVYLGEELTREQTEARLAELLALERAA